MLLVIIFDGCDYMVPDHCIAFLASVAEWFDGCGLSGTGIREEVMVIVAAVVVVVVLVLVLVVIIALLMVAAVV